MGIQVGVCADTHVCTCLQDEDEDEAPEAAAALAAVSREEMLRRKAELERAERGT